MRISDLSSDVCSSYLLAVVGFGLATLNWTVFGGAMMLFVTNLLTIALTAWAMARLYGFRSSLTERQSPFQNLMVIVVCVELAVPLFFSLRQIGWEYNAERIIRSEIMENVQDQSRLSEVSKEYAATPGVVRATVLRAAERSVGKEWYGTRR